MPFSIRPYRRFPVQCSVTYHAGPFLKLPLAYLFGFGQLIFPEQCSILVLLMIPFIPPSMKLHIAVVANSHISSQLTVDPCLSELDIVLSASFPRMRQVIEIMKEHASTPLSKKQVWFMPQDSAG
jgi:hypothetical protein